MPIIDVPHPSPVRFLPARARNEDIGFETIRTPVRIDIRGEDEFEALDAEGDGFFHWRAGLCVNDGAIWRPMLAWDLSTAETRHVTPSEMLAFMSGPMAVSDRLGTELRQRFTGTPFAAAGWGFLPRVGDFTWRAGDVPEGATGILREPDAAASALASFVRDEMRFAQGTVYRRVTPLGMPIGMPGRTVQICPVDRFALGVGKPIPIRCDMGAVGLAFAFPGQPMDLPDRAWLPPGELLGEGDAVDLANLAPAFVLALGHRARALAARNMRGDERRRVLLAIDEALDPIQDLAMTGRIRGIAIEGAERAYEASIRAARGIPDIPGDSVVSGEAERFARYLREVAVPRLSPARTDDELDLGTLAR